MFTHFMPDPTTTPCAYCVAKVRAEYVERQFSELELELDMLGCADKLFHFQQYIERGGVAINMSISNCVRFLKTGRWLNVYEATLEETANPCEIQKKLASKLGIWYETRIFIDQTFAFGPLTHYAALNLGGPGPYRYGECCVLIAPKCGHFPTIFPGDTLRAVFNAQNELTVSEKTLSNMLSTYEQRGAVAVVRGRHIVLSQTFGIDPARFRPVFESADSLLEVHLHGPVTRDMVTGVFMRRYYAQWLDDARVRFKRADSAAKTSKEFEVVPHFEELYRLLREHKIELRIVDDA